MNREITDKIVELSDGKRIRVGQWLAEISLKLPQSFKYKNGENKGQLVDHFTELIKEFDSGGKKAVLKYVDDCYELLNNSIKASVAAQ